MEDTLETLCPLSLTETERSRLIEMGNSIADDLLALRVLAKGMIGLLLCLDAPLFWVAQKLEVDAVTLASCMGGLFYLRRRGLESILNASRRKYDELFSCLAILHEDISPSQATSERWLETLRTSEGLFIESECSEDACEAKNS